MTYFDCLAKMRVFRAKGRCHGYPLTRVRSRDKVPASLDWQNSEANELLLEVTPGTEDVGTIK